MSAALSDEKPKIISLFCGAGGLDLGFSQAGFEVVLAADHDSASIETHNLNSSKKVAKKIDIANVSASELTSLAHEENGKTKIDGIIGGPPCQGFSQANTTRNGNDPRNDLARKYANLIVELARSQSLKFFVFENVAGLLEEKNAKFLASLKKVLSKEFHISAAKLNAQNYGVPQSRERFFMVGIRNNTGTNKSFSFPPASHTAHLTVSQTIEALPAATLFERGLTPSDIAHHVNHWTMRPKSKRFGEELVSRGRSLVRLDWDKPSRTVAYGHREIHVHPSGMRRLTIYEAMLLQGFPKNYKIFGNLSQQVTQVSNAVPPPLAKALATAVLTAINSQE